jgi:hypothetical protein
MTLEQSTHTENTSLTAGNDVHDAAVWKVKWKIEKWMTDEDLAAGMSPYDSCTIDGNILTVSGVQEMWRLITGIGGTTFGSGNAKLYVGSGTTAASSSDTDLVAGSASAGKTAVAQDTGFPTIAGNTVTYRSTFGSTSGNHDWQEVGVINGALPISSSVILLNRKLSSLGTKTTGSWQLSLSIQLG